MKAVIASLALCLILGACAKNVTPVATGGSRADGTVVVSYQYGMFEQPVVDYTSAAASAKKRCKAWGYRNAEPFDGSQSSCAQFAGGDCVQTQVNTTYQCVK